MSLPVHQSLLFPSVDSAVPVLVLEHHDPIDADSDDDDPSKEEND